VCRFSLFQPEKPHLTGDEAACPMENSMGKRKTFEDTPVEHQRPLSDEQKVRVRKRHKSLTIHGLYGTWKSYESALHRVGPVINADGKRAAPYRRTRNTWGKTVFLREMWLEKVRVLVPPDDEGLEALRAALAAEENIGRLYAQYSLWNAWQRERTDAGEEALDRAKRASVAVAEELAKRSGRFRQSWKMICRRAQHAAAATTGGEAPALEELGEGDD
jgi:hypothetical protein